MAKGNDPERDFSPDLKQPINLAISPLWTGEYNEWDWVDNWLHVRTVEEAMVILENEEIKVEHGYTDYQIEGTFKELLERRNIHLSEINEGDLPLVDKPDLMVVVRKRPLSKN